MRVGKAQGMGSRAPLTSDKGISLLETMIALVVIIVGLSALHRMFPAGVATGRHAVQRTQATLLGKGQLEQLRQRDFATLAATQFPQAPEPFLDSQQHVTFAPFRWHAEVTPRTADLLEVRLRVVWPWPTQMHQVQFATYVSKH